jgi:hypothetical protein
MMMAAPLSSFPLEITVNVIDPSFTSISSVLVLPLRNNPQYLPLSSKSSLILIQKPGYYYVEINTIYGKAHPLFIFVDEPS